MLSLQFASLHRNLLSSSSSSLLSSSKSRANPKTNSHDREFNTFKWRASQGRTRTRLSSVAARAVENRDSQPSQQQYKIDQDKARDALAKLDKQLESLSKKQVPSPKIRASDIKLAGDRKAAEKDVPELSGSFLAYSAGALLVFTILYNVLFYAIIKPSIDGPGYVPETPPSASSEAPNAEATGFSSPIGPITSRSSRG